MNRTAAQLGEIALGVEAVAQQIEEIAERVGDLVRVPLEEAAGQLRQIARGLPAIGDQARSSSL